MEPLSIEVIFLALVVVHGAFHLLLTLQSISDFRTRQVSITFSSCCDFKLQATLGVGLCNALFVMGNIQECRVELTRVIFSYGCILGFRDKIIIIHIKVNISYWVLIQRDSDTHEILT